MKLPRLLIPACLVACVLVLLPTAHLAAQEKSSTSINDLAWIAGHWQGEGLGGKFEETWNKPFGGEMIGMFKLVKDGKVVFYEILTIVPKDKSFVLRLKHFNSKLEGWEEKDKSVEFPFVSASKTEIKFNGLTFKKISDDQMQIVVRTQRGDKISELKFVCKRVKS